MVLGLMHLWTNLLKHTPRPCPEISVPLCLHFLRLQSIDLLSNQIGPEGAQSLATALSKSDSGAAGGLYLRFGALRDVTADVRHIAERCLCVMG